MTSKKEAVSLIGDMDRQSAIKHLLVTHDMDLKDAEAHWKEFGSKKKATFYADYYAELEKGEMSEDRFKKIIAAGTDNVKNHAKMYDNIRVMTNAIHATYAEAETE